MSIRDLEKQIAEEANEVSGCEGLLVKDIMEWSTGQIEGHPDETTYFLPELKINVSFLTETITKKKKSGQEKLSQTPS